MSNLVRVATCNLNQWAMDFRGNLERIKESIREAKAGGVYLEGVSEHRMVCTATPSRHLRTDTGERAGESTQHQKLNPYCAQYPAPPCAHSTQ